MNMKRAYFWIAALVPGLFISCEDRIFPELPGAAPALVIDAWINNKPEVQTIRLTRSLPYFEATAPQGLTGASVRIVDDQGAVFDFAEEDTPGVYQWMPDPVGNGFGQVGREYTLRIQIGENSYEARSRMNRVPEIDSISFRFEPGNNFFPDSYFGAFFARDPQGIGDTYWIRSYKNGLFLNRPSEINIAFDAAFSSGSAIDGIPFIQPIRDGISPVEQDDDGNFLSPFSPGDSVYVEIHSISNDAFTFLNEMRIQTDRPGGFAELFAVPLSNVPTNIVKMNDDDDIEVLGFFNVAAVQGLGRKLDPENLPVQNTR
jgi:hypothetical protein